ncbi:MAG: IS3 family transposase [Tissierellaceae bacterium]
MSKRYYEENFKKQLVNIYNQGNHTYRELHEQYGVSPSTIRQWVVRYNNTESFNAKDNLTEQEKELIELRKRNKQLEMENDILKQAALLLGKKVDLIISNREKYSISAMCKLLKVSRSLVYYHLNNKESNSSNEDSEIEKHIIKIFHRSKNNYGTRKIKVELENLGHQVSRRRIARIMKENALVSNYTVAQYKVYSKGCNESKISNILDRQFDNRYKLEVAVSDLTYVRVGSKWNYVCTLVDLYNREVIGYSAGPNKDASLIEKALLRCRYPLKDIKVFHSDRGREYDNKKVDNILETFEIERSLSRKGNPYDNAVIEAMNKVLKVEFIYQNKFETLEELELQLAEYIYWYNHIRIHGSLGYISPIEYRNKDSFKLAA